MAADPHDDAAHDEEQDGEEDAALFEAEGHRQDGDANDAIGQRDDRLEHHGDRGVREVGGGRGGVGASI